MQPSQPMSKIQKVEEASKEGEKAKYKVKNWSVYNEALVQRGNITLYFEESVLEGWYDAGPVERGGQFVYSDVCIESLLMIKTVFKLAYRQTQGFAGSLLRLMGIEGLSVPCYSQINRRAAVLNIEPFKVPASGPLHITIDSTGVKIFGEGEWKVRKHGYSKRRTWRKLHLGVDPDSGFIHAHTLTENNVDDGSQLELLLDQVADPVCEVSGDGAYDMEKCWDYLEENTITGIIPPRENAVYWLGEQGEILKHRRNEILKQIELEGRKQWKLGSGYHRRSLAETAMFRFKTIHGSMLYSRKKQTQEMEAVLKIKTLNIMTAQGMPLSEKVEAA